MMSEILFRSFSSGSCGNCYVFAIREGGSVKDAILVDAGVSFRRVRKELSDSGIPLGSIRAILVTHDHIDHIRSLGSCAKYLKLPIWASKEVHKALSHHPMTRDYVPQFARSFQENGWDEIIPEKLSVRQFTVPHDATRTSGFVLRFPGHTVVHITDCGAMTRETLSYLSQADSVVLESNYDSGMLRNGTYPQELKDRISSGYGHLSNAECAEAILQFAHPGLRNIFLCHLSENNNTPEKALESARKALEDSGYATTVHLMALPRTRASLLITL